MIFDVTLNGGPNNVFILQTAKGITQATGTSINLTGGINGRLLAQTAVTFIKTVVAP